MDKTQIVGFLIYFIDILRSLIVYALIGRIIFSFFVMTPYGGGKIYKFLRDVTDPVLNLVKKLPHKIGMIDLSPMIAIFGLDIIAHYLIKFLAQLI